MKFRIRHIATLLLMLFALVAATSLEARDKFTIVIDPGHGGKDAGTAHRKQKQDEKTIALNVALKLGRQIERNHSDVRVVYTRKTDVYPSLPDRVQKAKEVKGDLFISIHVNACPNSKARGFETYVFGIDDSKSSRLEERLVEERENLDINGHRIDFDAAIDIETKILCQMQREKHNKQSMEVAKAVHNNLIASLKNTSYGKNVNNRGIMAKNLFVLCYSPMPAILVELGYMSNPNEEKFINSEEAQSTFASSIYQGFKQYKASWDKRQLSHPNNSASANAAPEPEPEQPEARPEPQTSNDKPKATDKKPQSQSSANVWKIQFLSSDRLLKEGNREFKGLRNVSYYREGKLYKYTYGSAASTAALKQEMKTVRAKFPEAFFVKFNDKGERVK